MNHPIHILNQMGVLTSFSVAKKVSEDDINKYFSKFKRKGKSQSQLGDMLKQKILVEIQEAYENNKIPGIISQQEIAKEMGIDENIIKNMPELNRLITVITQKMVEKKYDKMSLCYFINGLVRTFELTEDDFNDFHEKNNPDDDEDDDGDDDE